MCLSMQQMIFMDFILKLNDAMKKIKKLIDTKTGAQYSIDKKLDLVKTVKTASNKLEELKTMNFQFTL
jgi:hypothetical protein